MVIYVLDKKCSPEYTEGCTSIETDFFDDKCKSYIEGYLFIKGGSVHKGIKCTCDTFIPSVSFSHLMRVQDEVAELNAKYVDACAALEKVGVSDVV